MREMRSLAALLVCALLHQANAMRRPVAAALNADGRQQDIQENMYPRTWIFTQEFKEPGNEAWRRDGPVRVTLEKTRIASLGGLKGIWNHKSSKPQYLEVEFPLKNDDTEYLVYRVFVKPGRFFNNAIQFKAGDVRKVTYVSSKEINHQIGTFTVKPVVPRPMVDRSLQC